MNQFLIEILYCVLVTPVLSLFYFMKKDLPESKKKAFFFFQILALFITYLFLFFQIQNTGSVSYFTSFIGELYESNGVLFGLLKDSTSLFLILFCLLLSGSYFYSIKTQAYAGMTVLMAGLVIVAVSATPFVSLIGLGIEVLAFYLLYWSFFSKEKESSPLNLSFFSQNLFFLTLSSAGFLCFTATDLSIKFGASSGLNEAIFSQSGLILFFLGLFLLIRPFPVESKVFLEQDESKTFESHLSQSVLNISVWIVLYRFIQSYTYENLYFLIGTVLILVSIGQFLFAMFQKTTSKESRPWMNAGVLLSFSFLFFGSDYAALLILVATVFYYLVLTRLDFLITSSDSSKKENKEMGNRVRFLMILFAVSGTGVYGFFPQAAMMSSMSQIHHDLALKVLSIIAFILYFSFFWRHLFQKKKSISSQATMGEFVLFCFLFICTFGFLWTNRLALGLEQGTGFSVFGKSFLGIILGDQYSHYSIHFQQDLLYPYLIVFLMAPLVTFLFRKLFDWIQSNFPRFTDFILNRAYFDHLFINTSRVLSLSVKNVESLKIPHLVRVSRVKKVSTVMMQADSAWVKACRFVAYESIDLVNRAFDKIYSGPFRRQLFFIMFTLFLFLLYFLAEGIL